MEENSGNPLLDQLRARIPGETFRLPSLGLFYNSGELSEDVKNGEVHVYPLTTIDEIVLGTPDKLLSGKAVQEVFNRCIPQIQKPMNLLSKDVDFLLTCLRILSYGPMMEIIYKHDCINAQDQKYDVELQPFVSSARAIDPTIKTEKFTVVLDSGQTVSIHPPVFNDVISLFQTVTLNKQETDNDIDELQLRLIKSYVAMIDNVNGITNPEHIEAWFKALPPLWSAKIKDTIEKASDWGMITKVTKKCKDCGEPIEIEVNTNPISFFM